MVPAFTANCVGICDSPFQLTFNRDAGTVRASEPCVFRTRLQVCVSCAQQHETGSNFQAIDRIGKYGKFEKYQCFQGFPAVKFEKSLKSIKAHMIRQ